MKKKNEIKKGSEEALLFKIIVLLILVSLNLSAHLQDRSMEGKTNMYESKQEEKEKTDG